MEISEELAQENLKSWEYLTEFYEWFSAFQGWDYLVPLPRLVESLKKSEYARYFRAGQSLWHLMISTVSQHGLTDDDLHIFVTINVEYEVRNDEPIYTVHGMEVSYKRGSQIIKTQNCNESELMTIVEPFLKRLWNETRGSIGNYYE